MFIVNTRQIRNAFELAKFWVFSLWTPKIIKIDMFQFVINDGLFIAT